MAAEAIPVRLDGETVIKIDTVAGAGGEEDIAHRLPTFDGFAVALSKIAASVRSGLEQVQPARAVVEFGVDVSLEAGQLTAMIVKGSGTAHVTVTMEWDLK
ncbi:CU044_2847 family protein [Actinoplanes philippinensis]|uniref:CU044_2847 family protein n=1 Tax=Actinoplanes philippinensis TaxID=35752 RepID=UPI0033C64A75